MNLIRICSRSLFTLMALATAISAALAQDERDALRFSFLQPQGTARSIGIGSALGSIGGDFTSLAVNPAGIGIYRRSEVTVTPSLTFGNTSSSYTTNAAEESGSHFAFSNLGLVTTKVERGRRAGHSGWTSVSFGLGLTRMADFTRDYSYGGTNQTSSGSFVFEADANTNGLNDQNISYGDLGYQSYLLDTFGGRYISVVNPTAASPVSQYKSVRERGGISELGITLGGSYEDKLMIGGTLGIPIVRYTRARTFTERDLSGNTNNDFDYFTYSDELKTNGAGLNLKLGFIYKPNDLFRFGAAIHTPTYYSLTDVYNQSLTASTENFADARTHTADALENQYDYNLSSPWRGVVSATAFLGTYGFLTADYEYVDYGSARFDFSDKNYQQNVNDVIKQTYQGASNIRTGLEIRLDNVSLRGGFGYYGNPYKSGNPSGERLDFSGGLGFRFQNAFIDLGFVHHQYKSSEQPYNLSGTNNPSSIYYGLVVPTANLETSSNNAVVTFGFKL